MLQPCSPKREDVTALILAAGDGMRLGNKPKAFLEWRGQTLLQHAIERVATFAMQIIVGVRESDLSQARGTVQNNSSVTFLGGGTTRLETLERLVGHAKGNVILIHEVARPFAPTELFQCVLERVYETGVAIPVVAFPVRDGVGVRKGDFLQSQLERSQLVNLQVPQAFRAEFLRDILHRTRTENLQADSLPGLALSAGYSVRVVDGCPKNLKITYEYDLKLLGDN